MQSVKLLKANNALQVGSVLLKLALDVCLKLGVDIVRTFADQPSVEDQKNSLFSLADEPKPREFFPLPDGVSDWIQRKIVQLFNIIFDVVIGEEHASGYLCDLDVSLPLVLNTHHSAVYHCKLAGAIIIFPGKLLPIRQRFYSQHHSKISYKLVFQIRRVKDMTFDKAKDLLFLSDLILFLYFSHGCLCQHCIHALGLEPQMAWLIMRKPRGFCNSKRHFMVPEPSLDHIHPYKFLFRLNRYLDFIDGCKQHFPIVLLLDPGKWFFEHAIDNVKSLLDEARST